MFYMEITTHLEKSKTMLQNWEGEANFLSLCAVFNKAGSDKGEYKPAGLTCFKNASRIIAPIPKDTSYYN